MRQFRPPDHVSQPVQEAAGNQFTEGIERPGTTERDVAVVTQVQASVGQLVGAELASLGGNDPTQDPSEHEQA